MATRLKWFIGVGVGVILFVALWVAAHFTPSVFLQMGNHFFGGPDLATVSGVWTCVPDPTEECEPIREGLLAAIGNDPHLENWWPWRVEFMRLD